MQTDQTVVSLRPGGGGGNRVPRFARFNSSSAPTSADQQLMYPHGGVSFPFAFKTGDSRFDNHERVHYARDQLIQLREVAAIFEDIMKIKREIEAVLLGEDQSWIRAENNVPVEPLNSFSDPNNCDWHGRSAQLTPAPEERSWDPLRKNREYSANRQDQLNSQFPRAQISSNQPGGEDLHLILSKLRYHGLFEGVHYLRRIGY